MTQHDGGPAFPRPVTPGYMEDGRAGMSLRDWFAGMALLGMFTNTITLEDPETMTEHAYCYSDAMLEARKVKEGNDELV